MVLHIPQHRGGAALKEAAASLQSGELLLYQDAQVPECAEHDIHLANRCFLVSDRKLTPCSLDDSVERNCDFLLAINFFTAYLLQTLGKLKESLNFISVAERVL